MKQSKIQDLLIEFYYKVNDLKPNNPEGNILNLNLISHDYSRKIKLEMDNIIKSQVQQLINPQTKS